MDSGAFQDDIASLRALGGDVVPSFGGYSADHGGTEIAETCKSVAELAAAYESVITAYDVSRLDMDVEVNALDRTFSIDRRNKALKVVEDWAAAQGRPLQIEYTLPVEPGGLELHARDDTPELVVGPRVGIDFASPEDRAAPWRIADAGSRWVSERKTLSPRA